MGKKGRKTRWRTLAITGESDSEDSSTLTGSQISRTYNHKPYFSKFSYSSQSTPTRRYQHEAKSTRSSSTASENKITFNEDEYTRITTPRQDVLFKKGYLNKPKNYQTQTSTGNSTTSTGNSTGNGTPDHQSADGAEGTDLEYESQFVFPNGFVDQNGIYYVNSFEPYPLVMYNPPICYPEYPTSRTKRYSTDSMTESTSPHNEDAGQDANQSGGENPPEYTNQPMYNVVYTAPPTGYYFNGVCGPNALANGQGSTDPRRIKKKRRRKISKSAAHDGTTSSDDCESSDEAVTQVERVAAEVAAAAPVSEDDRETERPLSPAAPAPPPSESSDEAENLEETEKPEDATSTCSEPASQAPSDSNQGDAPSKFNLNAEEFIPRAYRNAPPDQQQQRTSSNNLQFVNIHPNFIPIPLLGEMPPPPAHPAFLPPGIPLNFAAAVPPDPKLLPPNFVNFYVPKPTPEKPPETGAAKDEEEPPPKTKESEEEIVKKPAVEDQKLNYKSNIDIAKIVSKLEEAAKEQRLNENKRNTLRYYNNKFNKGQRFSELRAAAAAAKIRPKKDEGVQTNGHAAPNFTSPRRFGRTSSNYSDTLKKIGNNQQINTPPTGTKNICPRFERSALKKAPPPEKERAPAPNQWISVVSNRKKRKYKNGEGGKDDDDDDDARKEVALLPPPEKIAEPQQNSNQTKPEEEERSPAATVTKDETEEEEEEQSAKKKSKKGTQKPLMKRVMIVDAVAPAAVLHEEEEEEVAPPKKPEVETAAPEKKKAAKKKKKPSKAAAPPPMVKSPSVTGSSSALNNDDTYDFLLDSSVLEEKTNVEISEELDKMIQKGMYGNLEEKIRSMSVSPLGDDFFRTISFKRPAAPAAAEMTGANNFTALLKNTGRILGALKPPDVDFNRTRPPQDAAAPPPTPSTSKSGDFLEERGAKSDGKLKNKSKKGEAEIDESSPQDADARPSDKSLELDLGCVKEDDPKVVEEIGLKTLYPITHAVKEWMTKTRENTPEVELLKSPDTIYREFIEEEPIDEEESSEPDDSKNADGNPFPSSRCEEGGERVADETIVVHESESWEEEEEEEMTNGKKVERGEDVLEIYELKVKAAPKHGNLPYRAICCNLM